MKIFRWFAVSCSLYSRIPMPHFEWNEEDMRYSLVFFPVIGVIIGALSTAVSVVCLPFSVPVTAEILALALIPLLVTGGFHVDGFMDTEDAMRSYQPKEKKLEILKDPHIGAFAVIGLVKLVLIFALGIALVAAKTDSRTMALYAITFPLARAVTGLLSLLAPKAKKTGMLAAETKNREKAAVAALIVWMTVLSAVAIAVSPVRGLAVLAVQGLYAWYSEKRDERQFGGMTGDTSGHLLCVSEALMILVIGLTNLPGGLW